MVPVVDLSDTVGLGVIIVSDRGVRYTNQTGGTSCLHPSASGVYIPLRNDRSEPDWRLLSPEVELTAYFEGPAHRGAGATNGLSEADASFIDDVLARWRLREAMQVDRSRLLDSHEAWVFVSILGDDEPPYPAFEGFGPYPCLGVLTWCNSD